MLYMMPIPPVSASLSMKTAADCPDKVVTLTTLPEEAIQAEWLREGDLCRSESYL